MTLTTTATVQVNVITKRPAKMVLVQASPGAKTTTSTIAGHIQVVLGRTVMPPVQELMILVMARALTMASVATVPAPTTAPLQQIHQHLDQQPHPRRRRCREEERDVILKRGKINVMMDSIAPTMVNV